MSSPIMDRDLKNKVVVITGGAHGIGYAIAVKCLTQSAKVIILDVNETKGNEAEKTLAAEFGSNRVAFIKCDVTKDLEEVSNTILDTYKQVDVLVNNAGIVNELDIRVVMEVNAIAPIQWSMKFQDHMRVDKGGKGGTIINIASIYGYISDPFSPFYKATKHAVLGFTKTLGHENNFNITGVRVVAICPGYTSTGLAEAGKGLEEERRRLREFALLKPWQQPEAVGNAALEVFRDAESGTSWSIIGGRLEQVPYIYH